MLSKIVLAIILTITSAITEDDLELVLSQAIWRHGDRAAVASLPPVLEEDWVFGGGGLGELTPRGMGEMYDLGMKIRERYINGTYNFLSPQFNNKEVFIRAPDQNRTILSAMAELYAMYPPDMKSNRPGIDYPNVVGWQPGFIFVPVHSEPTSCTLSPTDCKCKRRDQLNYLSGSLPEVIDYLSEPQNQELTYNLTVWYNMSTSNPMFTNIPDALKTQRIHFNQTLYDNLPWYNEEVYHRIMKATGVLRGYMLGVFNDNSTLNGTDIGRELRTIQGGAISNEIYQRMKDKVNCVNNVKACSSYLRDLKFYGYSAHDQTVFATLTLFGLENITMTDEVWPEYSAAVFFELLMSKTTKEPYFRILYRWQEGEDIVPVTHLTKQCGGQEFCPLSVFEEVATYYKPLPDIDTLCRTDLHSKSSSSFNSVSYLFLVISSYFVATCLQV